MKRIVVLLMLLVCTVSFVFAQKPTAVIREMTGTVELKKAGKTEWVAAKPGETIEESTIISTGFRSTVVLSVGHSSIVVRALTRLSLETLMNRDANEVINLGLATGRIRATVNPPSGAKTDFSIRTPSATASVRGTVFEVDPVNLQVQEGTVNYQPAASMLSQPVAVGAGQESRVDTVTGKTLNPVEAAQVNRYFQPLPGQESSPDTQESAKLEVTTGSVAIDVVLQLR